MCCRHAPEWHLGRQRLGAHTPHILFQLARPLYLPILFGGSLVQVEYTPQKPYSNVPNSYIISLSYYYGRSYMKIPAEA